MLEWLELMLNEDGGVNETVRSSRIDKSVDGDRRLAWNQKMDQEGEGRGGEEEGEGRGEGIQEVEQNGESKVSTPAAQLMRGL